MKTKDEIRAIITQTLGITDMASYKAYCDPFYSKVNPRVPTDEEIALLDPDAIDNRAFWEVAEEIFGTDPVANCQYGPALSKMNGNRQNLHLYSVTGILPFIELTGLSCSVENILEIGPGYGAFKNWIEVKTKMTYFGADVYPKIPDVEETARTGLLTDVTKARTYRAVVSCNVFQHLSVNQRRQYYADIHATLEPKGFFMFGNSIDEAPDVDPRRDANGRLWTRHYGQFTEVQRLEQIYTDLKPYFEINLESNWRGAHYTGFVCIKKD